MHVRRLDKPRLAQLLRFIDLILALPTAKDCERADGAMTLQVIPDEKTGRMTVFYDMTTRYCCTCSTEDETSGKCGECVKSGREPGVYRDSPRYRGMVKSWRCSAPSAKVGSAKRSRSRGSSQKRAAKKGR